MTALLKAVIYRLAYQFLLFIAGLFIAALSGTELFGIISLMVVNAAAFIVITDFGTGASIVWHGAGSEMRDERLFSFAALSGVAQLLLFFVLEFVTVKISGETLLTRRPESGFYILYELVYFAGLVLTDKYSSLLYGHNKSVLANKTLSIVTAGFVSVFILMYLGVLRSINPIVFFCLMILALGMSQALVFHSTRGTAKITKPGKYELRSLVKFSGIVFATNIIQFFAYRLDFWLIDHFYNHSDLGIYAQANRFVQLIWILPNILASLLAPTLRNVNSPMNDRSFLALARVTNLLAVFITASVIVIASFFYSYFFPPAYSKGLAALLFMLPGYVFFATTIIVAAWFSAKRLLKVNLIGSSLCFLTILLCDLALIPRYSIKGAGIANTIAYSITTLYFVWQFRRYTGAPMKELFLWRKRDIFAFKTYVADES